MGVLRVSAITKIDCIVKIIVILIGTDCFITTFIWMTRINGNLRTNSEYL